MTDNNLTYTIYEFCELERISRSHLYSLWKKGRGPTFYRVGSRRRISQQSREAWQREREAEAQQDGIK